MEQTLRADYLSIGAFTKVFPVKEIKRVLSETGRTSKRERSLPNHLVVYYVLAMTMMMTAGYREVLRWLFDGMRQSGKLRGRIKPLCTSAITQARQRLGAEPFRAIFKSLASPIATKQTRGAHYKNWRLVCIDGSTLDVADSEENVSTFGYAHRGKKHAFPKLRFVCLIETGTKAIFEVAVSKIRTSEMELARQVIPALTPGMLCLGDRYFARYSLWKEAIATGADFLWRARANSILPVEKLLPDGSYISTLYSTALDRKYKTDGYLVRVIEYKINSSSEQIILLTTILDENVAPAKELAALYHERWEVETAFDELKTHLRGGNTVLRSKTPDLVIQEFFGLMLSYYCVRALMHEAALVGDTDPDRLSFLHSVRVIRRAVPRFGTFPPSTLVGNP